jgi:hypothetical protein
MSPMGLRIDTHRAGEGQEQFSNESVKLILRCIVNSCYLAMTREETEDFMYVCSATYVSVNNNCLCI